MAGLIPIQDKLEPFEDYLQKLGKWGEPKKFSSDPYYSPVGDFTTYFFADVPYYAKRVDELLTLYQSDLDNSIVGVKIEGRPTKKGHPLG